jgi:threonyl-tRNA synthetase
MINVSFPDGSKREYPDGSTPMSIAEAISKSLAKRSVIAKVNGQLYDMKRPLDGDVSLELLDINAKESLDLIRHDAAHVLAQAVQELFPGTQVTIGPTVEDGFYYDFARKEPFSTEDFAKIEAKMKEIVDRDLPINREVWSKDDAIAHFRKLGEDYKAQIIDDIIPPGEAITLYAHGDQWSDLCRGPHLPSTGKLPKAFKLMKLAGAYWRGDHRNEMLQRMYGTAWANEKDLAAHLMRLEEAEKRDHRKLGRELDLFHMQEEGKGMVFWHPKGLTHLAAWWKITCAAVSTKRTISKCARRRFWIASSGNSRATGRSIATTCLSPRRRKMKSLSLKPMNCPGHVQIFKQGQKSYRDLPMRMAEFGACHRYEPSGALHGLMRVRAFTQDDAHIFCREDQIESETARFITLAKSIHADFGLETDHINLATRPEVRAGSDEFWDKAEKQMLSAARAAGVEPIIAEGDGAFYAPKLDFVIKDAIGREWTIGTIQLDYVLPDRLDAEYVGEDGGKHRPVMLHRAILGSLERFIGVLIENFAGAFPMWLSPVQVVVASISEGAHAYAEQAAEELRAAGLRVAVDTRGEKINYKIREHSLQKIPVIAVVGAKEAEERKLALRRFGSQANEVVLLDDAKIFLADEALPPDLKRAKVG